MAFGLLYLIAIRVFGWLCCSAAARRPRTRRSWCSVMRSRCSGVRSPGRSRTGPTARLITSEPGCDSVTVAAEDLFVIETPGGGEYGA